jgi:hypothetical protein
MLCPHLLVHHVDTCVTARHCSSVSEATGVALDYIEILFYIQRSYFTYRDLYSLSLSLFLIPS